MPWSCRLGSGCGMSYLGAPPDRGVRMIQGRWAAVTVFTNDKEMAFLKLSLASVYRTCAMPVFVTRCLLPHVSAHGEPHVGVCVH